MLLSNWGGMSSLIPRRAAFKTSEVNRLLTLFWEEREAASYGDEAFYFINSSERVIIPMKILAYAFGGQYSGN